MSSTSLCIACGVFRTDLEALRNETTLDSDVVYLPGGLHNEPGRLRRELQEAIDGAQDYGRIVILYGLCGRGVVGLRSRGVPLVLPRVHDCISLFLGGAAEYRKQFAHAPGTYYISAGWYDEQVQPRGSRRSVSPDGSGKVRYPEHVIESTDPQRLRERYGRENAEEISGFLNSWKSNYTRGVYIDTGSDRETDIERYARNLAEENGWEYQRLRGSRSLIRRALGARTSDADILVVPPGHEIIQDTAGGVVSSAPVGGAESLAKNVTLRVSGEQPDSSSGDAARERRIGLGIDAGGTYTDAVIFDFDSGRVEAKSKARTTKWRYSEGIMNAVRGLPTEWIPRIDLVSISTTLVTNAIVEGNHRPVGLLLMPQGDTAPAALDHHPTAVVRGRMTIGGEVQEDIDPDEVRRAVRRMIDQFHVEAFAVSAYGGSVNPRLELAVKDAVRRETGLEVCCGHELSGSLNFPVRAVTAVLNAGVMPIMEDFLAEMETSVSRIGIDAPLLVVRGDGSVMSEAYAREFPVQTALSGPAASMAGARFLTGQDEAVVVDVGGTTSDIGFLNGGRVAVRDDGAVIGGRDTHVTAVDMFTTGLGGDSEILFQHQDWILGPRRIAPVSLLEKMPASIEAAFTRLEDWRESTLPLQFLSRTGKDPDFDLTSREQAIFDALEDGPLMIHEIRDRVGIGSWRLVNAGRLEQRYCLQRSGLTPTDLYHAEGRLELGSVETASAYLNLIAAASGRTGGELIEIARHLIVDRLGMALLTKLLEPGHREGESAALRHILDRGNRRIEIRPRMEISLIGLGAPAALMMSETAERLGCTVVVPGDGDVANAVGAIASEVSVTQSARIVATSLGGYRIRGLDGEERHYEELEEAERRCMDALCAETRRRARRAGTSAADVTVRISTEVARTAEGSELFIERRFDADISGVPDLV